MPLTGLNRDVLELLPFEPLGASLGDIAADLLGNRSKLAQGQVRRALDVIAAEYGGLYVGAGTDGEGRLARLYGLLRACRASVYADCGVNGD